MNKCTSDGVDKHVQLVFPCPQIAKNLNAIFLLDNLDAFLYPKNFGQNKSCGIFFGLLFNW